ncbi:MAG: nucleotidyltransferase domain-containing protein [Ardenticatenales bacterium]|jgi:predicted nucleotidyltransferase|nr:nucleotidyltransferase domain-containing protein [Ardenticatenales bacterium]
MLTPPPLPPPTVTAAHRATVRRRNAEDAAARAAKRDRAWSAARSCAALLRERFGAERIVVFGSLIENEGRWFGTRSDIDLAAWGIRDDDYFTAVGQLQGVAAEFGVDLVAMERCPDHLRATVEEYGVAL